MGAALNLTSNAYEPQTNSVWRRSVADAGDRFIICFPLLIELVQGDMFDRRER